MKSSYTVGEAAALLGVTPKTFNNWCKRLGISAKKTVGTGKIRLFTQNQLLLVANHQGKNILQEPHATSIARENEGAASQDSGMDISLIRDALRRIEQEVKVLQANLPPCEDISEQN